MTHRYRSKDIVILSLMIITFLIVAGISLSQIISMRINDGSANQNSDKGIACRITINTNTTVNITWYKGGIQNRTSNISCTNGVECSTSDGSGSVPNNDTRKNDVWMCKAEFINGTGGYESDNVSVNIVDTPPYQPRIFYNSNGTEIFNETVQLIEDNGVLFNVTSWDWDNDTITYILDQNPAFCSISGTTGIMNCTPTVDFWSGIRNWTFSIGAKTIPITVTSRSFSINVTAVNHAPTFSPALANQNFTEGQKFNYFIAGTDRENNTPLNLMVVSVVPYLNLTIDILSNTTFRIKLRNNDTIGTSEAKLNYTVTLSINDTDNLTFNSKNTTVSFQLIGVSFNHLPNISYVVYNNDSLTQGGNLNIYINATDIDNNTLTFSTGGLSGLYPVTYSSGTDYNVTVNDSSFAYAYINFTSINNSHVVTHNFTIYVFDTKENATKIINMFINNTNDPPYINEISNDGNNTLNNKNISNLTGYTDVIFKYKVNATDVDDLTYDYNNTGLGTYATNDSMFFVNSSTGWLNFMINISGNYTFMVNVTDRGGLMYNRTAHIEILPNHNPTFTPDPINLSCREYDSKNWPSRCYYNLSMNVSDLDNVSGDYIASYWTDSTIFTINDTTGIINFSANQSMVGVYNFTFNVTDSRGGMSSTRIYMIINNTNNAPNMSTPNMPTGNLLVGQPYQITYTASDLDLLLPINYSYDYLTFTTNITGPNTSIFNFTQLDNTTAILMINSLSGANHEGNYSINVTVNDSFNNKSSYFMNIYLYNATNPPLINQIIPSGTPWNDTINNLTWINVTLFPGRMTTITVYENQTHIFNQTSTADNSSYSNHLDYQWYYDGVPTVQTQHYQAYFDFFSSEMTHNITVVVTDQYHSSSSFTWFVDAINVNRPPIYYPHSLENLTITRSTSIPGYLTHLDLRTRFYDPDDDPLNLGYSTDTTTNLTFSSSVCEYANFSFENHILSIDTIKIGECYVVFNATDPINTSMSVSSELILINITNVTNTSSQPIEVPINVQSTGGGTNTQPLPIPLPQEVEKPRPLQLITPKLVTTYKNSTIKIPIVINNTWNDTLVGIMLEAYTNATNVSIYLDRMYIPKLSKGESVETNLYVKNYKSEGHYEIQIRGNVTVPEYSDTATIYINSAEMRSEGDELENKISFAKDLLSSNPECQELNELLSQAQKELDSEDYAGTAKIVDSVLNGCKYLVNNAKNNKEIPDRNFIKTFEWQKSYNDYIIIGIFGMLFLASLYYILKKDNPEQDF